MRKLTGGEQIAVEMNKWSSQNAASLEARRVETTTCEAGSKGFGRYENLVS